MSTELAELFAKAAGDYDPEGRDLAAVVRAMRELRAQFELGLKAPAAQRPPRAKKAPAEQGDLDLLKDLDL